MEEKEKSLEEMAVEAAWIVILQKLKSMVENGWIDDAMDINELAQAMYKIHSIDKDNRRAAQDAAR